MFDLVPSNQSAVVPPPAPWTAERYLDVLHPRDGRGVVGALIFEGDSVRTHTLRRDILPRTAATLVEQESYVAMNPYFGPRGGNRQLAGLNAIWVDLDIYRVSSLVHLPRHEIKDQILASVVDAGLPTPSMLIDSGKGFYAVWLVTGASPAALPRWRAVMRALTNWAKPYGGDAACVDPARVLRLPGSWHESAGRQVAVVFGDGARYRFELLADSIWRAAGRPSRRDLKSARPRSGRDKPKHRATPHPRGLPRRAFWTHIQDDLDRLLQYWGGVIPDGMRNLWLHAWCCALTWTNPAADILTMVVARASTVAPGLKPRDVERMMRPTVRRGLAAILGQPKGCDPRYDYSGARLCELLAVDRQLATGLNFQQLLPIDLRADRNRYRRTERRRADGALPRTLWLAAHPISRERPWEAEGISRATWYRRQADARQSRKTARLDSFMSGAADTSVLRETGRVTPYKGEAQPSTARGLTSRVNSNSTHVNRQPTNQAQKKTTRPAGERSLVSAPPVISGAETARPSTEPNSRMEATMSEPYLVVAVLTAASQRLSHAETGAMTCLALELARGPGHRLDLARRAGVPPDMLDRIDAWLHVCAETRMVTRLVVPGHAPRHARGQRQGLLFDQTTLAPTPATSRNPDSLRAATIKAGVRVLGRAGISDATARTFLGKIIKENSFGHLAEAIDALATQVDDVAEPRAWITAFVNNRAAASPGSGRPVTSSRPARGAQSTPSAMPASKQHPLATPEFLGISPRRAERICEQNRQLKEKSDQLFGELRKMK